MSHVARGDGGAARLRDSRNQRVSEIGGITQRSFGRLRVEPPQWL
jgi:hypothetical protein